MVTILGSFWENFKALDEKLKSWQDFQNFDTYENEANFGTKMTQKLHFCPYGWDLGPQNFPSNPDRPTTVDYGDIKCLEIIISELHMDLLK